MTQRRDAEPYDVPIVPLPGGRGQGRRAGAVAVALVLVVGGAIGLARLSADRDASARGSARPSSGAVAVGGSQAPTPSSATAGRSTEPRVERLVDAPDRELSLPPRVVLLQQDGQDIRQVEWVPGHGRREGRTFHDAVPAGASAAFPILAPTGDHLVLLMPPALVETAGDIGRLVDPTGRILWTADDLVSESGAIWSAEGRTVVAVGNERRWHLVKIGDDGAATDRVVTLPGAVFLPSPTPIGSLSIPSDQPRTIPIGFSEDGRWVYGGIVSPTLGVLIGAFRVELAGSRIERVLDFGVGRPDGLVPQPGTLGGHLVDPVSGRVANWRTNPDTSGGSPSVEVREPDSTFVFEVTGDTPIGSAWGSTADAGLYVLSADTLIFPSRAALARIGADGRAESPILETGPVTSVSLIGLRDGYAALVVVVSRPADAGQLVLVDVADPSHVAALSITFDPERPIVAVELAPAVAAFVPVTP